MENNKLNSFNVSFSVDAGLIDRLGKELVGRAETAVSELIKNAYDADSTEVEVNFINSYNEGGTLEISDNGTGMNLNQLQKGFMTISSTDKLHNPSSEKYQRSRAGKKGIGRFATQRLGNKLTIITQTLKNELALKLTIDWDKYIIDRDITQIQNSLEEVEKIKPEGTTLIIENLRESWTDASIKRIYRYVSDLFQPDYLSTHSWTENIAKQNTSTFNVKFYIEADGVKAEIASPQKMIFDKSLASIEGYVDNLGNGYIQILSEKLNLKDSLISVFKSKDEKSFKILKHIHFKAYYFIYNRLDYYTNISKLELSSIQKLAHESGGMRLYVNGFRVLPYGEPKDDWLGLDIRYSGTSGMTNIPFSNNNLFGFVEILDKQSVFFKETASREGLIENEAFYELNDFLSSALNIARLRIAEGITLIRKEKVKESDKNEDGEENLEKKSIEEEFEQLDKELGKQPGGEEAKGTLKNIQDKYYEVIEELSMLRILASLGLTIGEFTHEIIQFTPSINGFISKLYESNQRDLNTIEILDNLKKTFANFTTYTSYFNATVSENTSRETKPILLPEFVNYFAKNLQNDLQRQHTTLEIETFGYDLYTCPMHISEWSSVLYNLYTNSKKAIKRSGNSGKIKIITGTEDEIIYLEFLDNGDGIPEVNVDRVFNAFFTTSTPAGFDAPLDDKLTGTGLGLKIVRDIIETYNGKISIIPPEKSYNTCFRIEVPKATKNQLDENGL